MDLPKVPETRHIEGLHGEILRILMALVFSLLVFFCFSFIVGFVAISAANFPITTSISVPSQCRIVSSSVDLRSSKVCELGLLNYNAKHVLNPFEKKFRCRYDYYWASVFEVEYIDHSSGETVIALAEAPKEALPLNCRPSFGAAWSTRNKFKVNETYECWYSYGVSKVSIYKDNIFNCKANDPSAIEMFKRYSVLSTRVLPSWFFGRRARYWRWETIAGVVTGFSTSLVSISLVKIFQLLKPHLSQIFAVRTLPLAAFTACFKRGCFLVVYFSFVGWLAIHHVKRHGLPEIF
ncbi:hypothetical protein RJ641_035039 [Dillenia turbinata]|uniref:Uncharacterized protein n=1 Tax=Dillenia turbinata TaxID=194707 RepID=A0AAN8VJM7_9MAGN